MPDEFPLDTNWRVAARFRPYPEPRLFRVEDITLGLAVPAGEKRLH